MTHLSVDELERRYRAAVTGDHLLVETMAALALVASYGLALSALGGYLYHPRLHTPYAPYAPLFLAVGWGTLLYLLPSRAGWASYARSMASKAASRVISTHRSPYFK